MTKSDTETTTDEIDPKTMNNNWSSHKTVWGYDFVAKIDTSGNEAKGEGPHVSADLALLDQLKDENTAFSAKHRPDSADGVQTPHKKSRKWESEDVTLIFSLAGAEEIVFEEFEATAEAVSESLPEEFEVEA